jgi:surface antigen
MRLFSIRLGAWSSAGTMTPVGSLVLLRLSSVDGPSKSDVAQAANAALRDQPGTAGSDARDRTSVAAAVTAGEEDAQSVVVEAAKAPA